MFGRAALTSGPAAGNCVWQACASRRDTAQAHQEPPGARRGACRPQTGRSPCAELVLGQSGEDLWLLSLPVTGHKQSHWYVSAHPIAHLLLTSFAGLHLQVFRDCLGGPAAQCHPTSESPSPLHMRGVHSMACLRCTAAAMNFIGMPEAGLGATTLHAVRRWCA